MPKRLSKKKSVEPSDPIELVAKTVQTVVDAVKKVVADTEPLPTLPPAELVPETPPPSTALAEPASEPPAKKPADDARGKRGEAKGVAARAHKLTAEQRRKIAKKAAARSRKKDRN